MKVYPLGLVGEVNYQRAILDAYEGEAVRICHEPDNPYDDKALRVENGHGNTIGYIPKSSWLREAIHEEGRGATATIAGIEGPKGRKGVVIHVTLSDDVIAERSFGQNGPKRDGLFSRLFRR